MINLENRVRIPWSETPSLDDFNTKIKRIKEIVITPTGEQDQQLAAIGYRLGYEEHLWAAAIFARNKFLEILENKAFVDSEFDKAMLEVVQASQSESSGKNENWVQAIYNKRKVDAELNAFVGISEEVGLLGKNLETRVKPQSSIADDLRKRKEAIWQRTGVLKEHARSVISLARKIRGRIASEWEEAKKHGLIHIYILPEDGEKDSASGERLKTEAVPNKFLGVQLKPVFHAIQKYWETNAISEWGKEAKKNPVDINRRLKVLKAIGATGSAHARTFGAMALVSGMEVGTFLIRDRKGRLILTGLALLMFLVNNHDTLLNQIPSFSEGLASVDIGQSVPVAHAFPDTGGLPLSDQVLPVPDAPVHQLGVVETQPDFLVQNTVSSPPVVSTGMDVGIESVVVPEKIAEVIPTPPVIEQTPVLSGVQSGVPIEPQIRAIAQKLPGDLNDNYYRLLLESFGQFTDKFELTARTIVDAPPGSFDQSQVQAAKEQLDAITKLKQSTIDPSSETGYDTLMKAMRYWR